MTSVAVNLSVLAFLRYFSALYLLFAAYFKDVVTVLIALTYSGESVDGTEIQGWCVLLLALAVWRWIKYQDDQIDKEEVQHDQEILAKNHSPGTMAHMNPQSPTKASV